MYLKPSPISSAAYTAAHLLGVASLSQEYVARTTLASLMGKQLVGWWGGERERETLLDRETPRLHLAESSLPAITESVSV